jgi:hypothetical protein
MKKLCFGLLDADRFCLPFKCGDHFAAQIISYNPAELRAWFYERRSRPR